MVLTASSLPVGLMMNQNKTLVMLTIQMAYHNGASQCDGIKGKTKRTNTVEVETVTEHQLPGTQLFHLKGLDGTKERKAELKTTGERRGRHREEGRRVRFNLQKRSRAEWGRPSRFLPRRASVRQCTPGRASAGQLRGRRSGIRRCQNPAGSI